MLYEVLLAVGCTYFSGAEELGRCGKVNARQPLGDTKGENEDSSVIALFFMNFTHLRSKL